MAERKGDHPQVEDIKCNAHDVDGIGEEFTDTAAMQIPQGTSMSLERLITQDIQKTSTELK
jgi:hypothetical protein